MKISKFILIVPILCTCLLTGLILTDLVKGSTYEFNSECMKRVSFADRYDCLIKEHSNTSAGSYVSIILLGITSIIISGILIFQKNENDHEITMGELKRI